MNKLGHFQQVLLKVWKITPPPPKKKMWKIPHFFFNFDSFPKAHSLVGQLATKEMVAWIDAVKHMKLTWQLSH